MKHLILFCLLMFCVSSFAGAIDDGLYAYLDNMTDGEMAGCMIVMTEQFNISTFKQTMTMANSTRQERHRFVISNLQEIAASTQADLLAYLAEVQRRGEIDNYKSYWIVNAVYAGLSKNIITEIAGRSDVEIIYLWEEPELIKPVEYDAEPPAISSVEDGLMAIGAPEMWALGYTGAGRLVANIDTGVDGNHPALNARWRGNNGAPADECWLDTANPSSDFPYDSDGHGTHTMGTMTGLGEASGDTIGVAFDAQWIASRAIVDGGSAGAAFQWLADPDGDPNTIDDVPDVISNSWGYHDFTCPSYVWSLIDNCEAAGIVVVFAAGNRYSGDPYAESVWAPASRNTTQYNTFSVGAVNGHNASYPIADFSARGPSQCDHQTIKPEVVAPGVSVRSCVPGGGYQSNGWSGTSMATPHVAGAVALLRQYNPNASVDTIKWALMMSATDLGSSGEDNTFGYGIINVRNALDLIPAPETPNLYMSGFEIFEPNNNYPDPGEAIELVITLANTGTPASNVWATITTENPYAVITQDSAFFGDIGQGEEANNDGQRYGIAFSEETLPGTEIHFELQINSDGYSNTGDLFIRVGHPGNPDIANFNIGACDFTISNFGEYGLFPTDLNPDWFGLGYKTPRYTINYLFEGALLIGDSPTRVSNAARDEAEIISSDFLPLTGIEPISPGTFGDLEYYCRYDDQGAEEPLGITISQTSYGWIDSPDNTYIITKYDITNEGDADLDGVRVAHFEDWDMPMGDPLDRVNFDRDRNLGYQYNSSNYRGAMVLNHEGVISFKALHNDGEVYPPAFTMEDKWSYMNTGFSDTAITVAEDASMMITTGPFNIPFGSTVTAAFAILGANNLATLQAVADAAIYKYETMTDIEDHADKNLPLQFGITSNYPNPFNPSTSVKFAIDNPGQVKLEIFDILGRQVRTLADEFKLPGVYEIIWDSKDFAGQDVASGIYFVRLSSDDQTSVKKMTLLR